MALPNCWQIMECGRETGGSQIATHGECRAFKRQMGHSCWVVAGTLCGGEVQGTFAQKQHTCVLCQVYQRYGRAMGADAASILKDCPDEAARYDEIVRSLMES